MILGFDVKHFFVSISNSINFFSVDDVTRREVTILFRIEINDYVYLLIYRKFIDITIFYAFYALKNNSLILIEKYEILF